MPFGFPNLLGGPPAPHLLTFAVRWVDRWQQRQKKDSRLLYYLPLRCSCVTAASGSDSTLCVWLVTICLSVCLDNPAVSVIFVQSTFLLLSSFLVAPSISNFYFVLVQMFIRINLLSYLLIVSCLLLSLFHFGSVLNCEDCAI